MSNSPRVIFIGLDAFDPSTARELVAAGRLPAIGEVINAGRTATVVNPRGLYVGALWPTLASGLSPADHGTYCFAQAEPASYAVRTVHPEAFGALPFWEHFDGHGVGVGVVDAPLMPLSRLRHGLQVVDLDAHDRRGSARAWPTSILDGQVVELDHCDVDSRAGRLDDLVASLLTNLRAKGDLLQGIVDEGGLDAVVTMFGASHCVGHQCWHLHDSAHPRAGTTPSAGDPVVRVYEAIDREVGRLLERCTGAAVVLHLSHGMRSHTGASQLLDELVARASDALAPASTLRRRRERVYRGLRYHGNRLVRRAGAGDELYVRPLDASLLAFAVPNNDAHGGIRLNLRGREPRGRVAATDADSVRRELTAMLLEVRDLDTGTPLIEDVLDVRDVEHGAALARLPDLLVLWHQGALGERVEAPWLGRIERPYRGHRTGDHRPDGVIAVRHPSLQAGASDEAIRTVDIAPLVASILDAPPAPIWTGAVPKGLLAPTLAP